MGRIGHGYGSEWQLMWYLARHREDLSRRVAVETRLDNITWCDFPGANERGCDSEWKGVGFLRSADIESAWSRHWPSLGNPPNWDAVAQGTGDGKSHWLLVEAKAHTAEVRSDCGASDAGGRRQIAATLEAAKRDLGVSPDRDWLAGYYQFSNRLAVLKFLLDTGIAARLVLIYFYGDVVRGGNCPQDATGWDRTLAEQEEHVGLPLDSPIRSSMHKVFLPAFTNLHARPSE